MSETECICGAETTCDDACGKHPERGPRHLYPCGECFREWELANPRTAAAIGRFAEGKGSSAAINKARREDEETK